MRMDVFAGIDGSGPFRDDDYKAEFAKSFVKQTHDNYAWTERFYVRGPSDDGLRTSEKARDMAARLENLVLRSRSPTMRYPPGLFGSGTRLFLAGYSRGGAAITETCRILKSKGLAVHCLMLFDAVDMTHTLDADEVPDNVAFCFHATRSPASRSRTGWGNCATRAANGQKTFYRSLSFLCTHGGMGGLPWRKDGPRGVINEAFTTEEAALVTGTAPIGVQLVAHALNQAHHLASDTAITAKEDKRVSGLVFNWMLNGMHSVMYAERPFSIRPPEHFA